MTKMSLNGKNFRLVVVISVFLLCWLGHIEVKVEPIAEGHFVKVLAHLLTPLVADAFLKAGQVAALGQLRHELLAVLPLVEGADLRDLPGALLLLDVEEGWSVADLTQPGHLVLFFHLEQRQLFPVAMLVHLMGQGRQNDCSCLAPWAEITEDLHDALLNGIVVENLTLEVIRADALGKDVGLKPLSLMMMLQRVALLVGAIEELLDLILEFARLVMVRHEHDVLLKRIVTD